MTQTLPVLLANEMLNHSRAFRDQGFTDANTGYKAFKISTIVDITEKVWTCSKKPDKKLSGIFGKGVYETNKLTEEKMEG
ncbi:MAG: hypothetical protein GC193_14145 [Cryomorphaceae bacterium]|nr:hypothetical protein [Cryomorphaceae bacterium]